MYPYDGIESWILAVLGLLAVIAVAIIIFAFKQESKESKAEDVTAAKKHRKIKYMLFSGFFVIVMSGLGLGLASPDISQKSFQQDIRAYIETNDVRLVEGFVDPSMTLVAGTHAKFVVETENGLVRCRATAEDKNTEIDFSCQDYSTEDWDFIVPLAEINEHVKNLAPAETAEKDADMEEAGSETEPAPEN